MIGTSPLPGFGPESGVATQAELDVAALAAQGLTNREIGAKLFVSVATVKTHIHHIYAKLGIRTRAELSRIVAVHE